MARGQASPAWVDPEDLIESFSLPDLFHGSRAIRKTPRARPGRKGSEVFRKRLPTPSPAFQLGIEEVPRRQPIDRLRLQEAHRQGAEWPPLQRASVTFRGCKNTAEWPDESSFRRPVRDGEYDVGKCPRELAVQGITEVNGRQAGVVGECPAPPRAQDQSTMTIRPCDGEHAPDALPQQIARLRLADVGRVRRCAGDGVQLPRRLQFSADVGPEDGYVRRIDHPIRGIRSPAPPVFGIHRVVNQGLEQGTGTTKYLLLGSGTAQEAPARERSVSEVQRERPQAF